MGLKFTSLGFSGTLMAPVFDLVDGFRLRWSLCSVFSTISSCCSLSGAPAVPQRIHF